MAAGERRTRTAGPYEPCVEGYIDKREVGRRLQAGLRTVEEWMAEGRLPYYKVGTVVRFKWSEIEAYLDRHCRVSPKSRNRP